MRYFLGVDGGGSKTMAVVIDESGRVCGLGKSSGSNYQGIGIERATRSIRTAIEAALSHAGLVPDDIAHAVYGLAGADRAKDLSILLPACETLPIASWRVVCDTMIGLRCGSPTFTGIVLVCGSGTNAAGRNANGDEVQTGGFGYLYGDWAGGGDLAREAFRMAVRAYERREPSTVLTEMVPSFLGYPDTETMLNDYLDHDRDNVPRDLAIVVHQAAESGDEVASGILTRMGRELGIAANSVALRLQYLEQPFDLVLVGSVVQRGRHPRLIHALEQVLQHHGWAYRLTIPDAPPVCGALWLALDDVGIPIPESHKDDLLAVIY